MLIIFGTFNIEIKGKSEHLCIMNDSKPGFHVMIIKLTNEPRREKTWLRGFRPGPRQTDLYKLRKELEA